MSKRSKAANPTSEQIEAYRQPILAAGATFTVHDMNQWNIRKGKQLILWFPFSKKHMGCNKDIGAWIPKVTLEMVLAWLDGHQEAQSPATPIQQRPPGQQNPAQASQGLGELSAILARLDAIEKHLAETSGFVVLDPLESSRAKLASWLGQPSFGKTGEGASGSELEHLNACAEGF